MVNTHYVAWITKNGMQFRVEGRFSDCCALYDTLKSCKDVREVSQGSIGK